jgi:hypothetical protein
MELCGDTGDFSSTEIVWIRAEFEVVSSLSSLPDRSLYLSSGPRVGARYEFGTSSGYTALGDLQVRPENCGTNYSPP